MDLLHVKRNINATSSYFEDYVSRKTLRHEIKVVCEWWCSLGVYVD